MGMAGDRRRRRWNGFAHLVSLTIYIELDGRMIAQKDPLNETKKLAITFRDILGHFRPKMAKFGELTIYNDPGYIPQNENGFH